MNAKKQYPVFKKALAGVIIMLIFGSLILMSGTKDKSHYAHTSGQVIYLGKIYEELPTGERDDYRYLYIDTYPKMFELYVGKNLGNSKPEYERIDELRKGDTLTVYFDIDPGEPDIRLNRLMQFIEKGGKTYYIRGSKNRNTGYFFIAIGVLLGSVLFYLKKTGRIV